MIRRRRLLFAMLGQKFRETGFRHRKMFSAQTFPNFFIVAEGARIVTAGFVTRQVLNFSFSHILLAFSFALFFIVLLLPAEWP